MKKFTLLIASLFFTIGAMAQVGAQKSEIVLTTEAGQPGYISTPHDHAVINPDSQWDKGGIAALIDGDPNTHFHTAWNNVPAGPHYFQVDLGENNSITYFAFDYTARKDASDDYPTEFTIKGSNDDSVYEQIAVVDVSSAKQAGASFSSTPLGSGKAYRYLRFEVTDTYVPNGSGYRIYFHAAEFDLFAVAFNMPFEYADNYENVDTWYYAVINSTGHDVETGALGDGKYMRAGTSDIPADTQTFGLSDVDAYSWGFVGDPINGFKMVSKGGKAIKTNNQAETKAELVDIAQGTVFTVKNPENAVPNRPDAFCLLNTNNYLNLQSGYVKQWTGADRGSTILLTQRGFDVTISDLGYATLFLDRKVYIPEGVEAYIVKSDGLNDDYITLTQVTGILPKNTGVVLKNAGPYEFITAVENATADVAGNLLAGSAEDVYVEGAAYVLANKDGIGLYKAELNKNATGGDGDTHFKNNANKAYLPASVLTPAQQTVAFYGFDWDGTTGIEQITDNREQSTVIYDLTGRRIDAITAPGIYVVNGKKVLVK